MSRVTVRGSKTLGWCNAGLARNVHAKPVKTLIRDRSDLKKEKFVKIIISGTVDLDPAQMDAAMAAAKPQQFELHDDEPQ